MVEWEFLVQEVKVKQVGAKMEQPISAAGWEPIAITYGAGGFGGDRFFVLLRRAR